MEGGGADGLLSRDPLALASRAMIRAGDLPALEALLAGILLARGARIDAHPADTDRTALAIAGSPDTGGRRRSPGCARGARAESGPA